MAERTTILLAEDDVSSRRILTHLLQRSGYEVLVAEDGRQALSLIGSHVHVALIDWMMPGVDGIEVCRRLKQATGGRAFVIMITARAEKPDVVHALDAGADDYLTKPVDHAELLARVRAAERMALRERKLAEAWQEARSEADRDALTGLFTRRVFDDALTELTAGPPVVPVALLMIDLDHFKQINDTYGHRIGDEVLRAVADTIRSEIRSGTDIAARYGGEEIAVIAPATDLRGAEELAERIRARVEQLRLVAGGRLVTITVSAGVSVLNPHRSEADPGRALVERADARLYAAKAAGRNQIAA